MTHCHCTNDVTSHFWRYLRYLMYPKFLTLPKCYRRLSLVTRPWRWPSLNLCQRAMQEPRPNISACSSHDCALLSETSKNLRGSSRDLLTALPISSPLFTNVSKTQRLQRGQSLHSPPTRVRFLQHGLNFPSGTTKDPRWNSFHA